MSAMEGSSSVNALVSCVLFAVINYILCFFFGFMLNCTCRIFKILIQYLKILLERAKV